MTAPYVLTDRAKQDLAEIADHVFGSSGLAAAEHVVGELRHGFRFLAETPDVGHVREDLTDDVEVRIWTVWSYLIVFVPAKKPLGIVAILHGARDPKSLAEHIRQARTLDG